MWSFCLGRRGRVGTSVGINDDSATTVRPGNPAAPTNDYVSRGRPVHLGTRPTSTLARLHSVLGSSCRHGEARALAYTSSVNALLFISTLLHARQRACHCNARAHSAVYVCVCVLGLDVSVHS